MLQFFCIFKKTFCKIRKTWYNTSNMKSIGGMDMAAKIKTDFGSVTIDSEVIARVAGLAAME